MDDLFRLGLGVLLELIAEGAAAVIESRQCLVDDRHLIAGSSQPGGGVHAQHDVVERLDVAVDRQYCGC